MARDMLGHLRTSAAAKVAHIKEHLAHHDLYPTHHRASAELAHADGDSKKHSSWSHFTSGRFMKRSYSDSDAVASKEKIVLLPGWVSRKYHGGPELSNRAGNSPRHFLFKEKSLMVRRCPV